MPPFPFGAYMEMNQIMEHLLIALEFGHQSAIAGRSLDETVEQFIFIVNNTEETAHG